MNNSSTVSSSVDVSSGSRCSGHREDGMHIPRQVWSSISQRATSWFHKPVTIFRSLFNEGSGDPSESGHGTASDAPSIGGARHCDSHGGSHMYVDNRYPGRRGLVNLGNTCYMNSALQCLSSIEPLRNYFIGDYQNRYDLSKHIKSGTGGAMAEAFSRLLKKMWNEDQSTQYIVAQELECIQIIVGDYVQQFSSSSQCDSQEFLMYFLEALHEDLKKHVHIATENVIPISSSATATDETAKDARAKCMLPENSMISDLFQGWLETYLTCGNEECGKVFKTCDAFMFLPLPLPDVAVHMPRRKWYWSHEVYPEIPCSLHDCLKLMTEESITRKQNWFCDECSMYVNLKRKVKILQAPEILMLYFKRFRESRDDRYKLGTHINFPEVLDLCSFSEMPCTYDLFAMIDHHGSLDGGHYTASTQINGEWYLFDDDRVSKHLLQDLIKNRFVYVLFYKKQSVPQKTDNTLSNATASEHNIEIPSPPINCPRDPDNDSDSSSNLGSFTKLDQFTDHESEEMLEFDSTISHKDLMQT